MATGNLLKGGQVVERVFSIDEYLVYVKARSILPFSADVKNLSQNDEPLRFTVFLGDSGTFLFTKITVMIRCTENSMPMRNCLYTVKAIS